MKPRPWTYTLCCREIVMDLTFYIAGAVAVISASLMLTRLNLVHALLYLIVSFLAVAVDFFVLGAPFVAALEAIIYAGAIMVLFLFVVMMLNLGKQAADVEKQWLTPGIWFGPAILAGILIVEIVYSARGASGSVAATTLGPKQIGIALFGPYIIGVELASMLLLAGLVGAYHLGLRSIPKPELQHDANTHERRTDTSGDLVLAGADRSYRSS
jgi:NADH-quinone oxidoreductase subunit J